MVLSPAEQSRRRSEFDDELRQMQKDVRSIAILIRRAFATKAAMTAAFDEGGQWDTAHGNADVAALHQSFADAWAQLYGAFSAAGVPVATLDSGDGNTSIEAMLVATEVALSAFDELSAASSVDGVGMLELPGPSPFVQ